jgi:hypothetical protein
MIALISGSIRQNCPTGKRIGAGGAATANAQNDDASFTSRVAA